MLILLRIIFGFWMYTCYRESVLNAQVNPLHGDLSNAFWVANIVIAAMANGIVWAPYFADYVSDPLTGGTMNSEFEELPGLLWKLIRIADRCNLDTLVRWLCFLKCIQKPWLPSAYILGLSHSREGSWLEKVYAREVFKFNNAINCVKAYQALKRHNIDPRPHHSPGVNLVLTSYENEGTVTPDKLAIPQAPPPQKIARDPRIKLGTGQ